MTQRIKLRFRRSAEDIIEIGRDLDLMQGHLGHGNFLPWIEAEFGMSRMTASRFMQVAEVYGSKSNSVIHLDPTALYELAAPKTPIEVREEVGLQVDYQSLRPSSSVASSPANPFTISSSD